MPDTHFPFPRFILDGKPVDIHADDTILSAALRADLHPTGGGCLCCAGDCPHCLITLDGVSYVRACQTPARPGQQVERHHLHPYPPLPDSQLERAAVTARHLHTDVVVIGLGQAGRKAKQEAEAVGKRVIGLDANAQQEVIGIYEGILVVARTEAGMLHIYADEVVVATGAAEIQPVAAGSDLSGLLTARAATKLARAGIDLGKVVSLGIPPDDLEVAHLEGDLVRFEGTDKLEAVVVSDSSGNQQRVPCDTVTLGLGYYPRDALVRMGHGLNVRAVGDCAQPGDIPPCPTSGVLCPCSGVTVADMEAVWKQGFHELELVKRATLAGTGTCQGSVCLPHIRSFLQARGEVLQAPFTARPMTRQVTIGEVAAGAALQPTPRTALDSEHRKLGATMDRIGGWWRPWNYNGGYGTTWAEYWAVREAVSLGDVSTLGKLSLSGPDALPFLERLYPTQVATIKNGRSRYALLLDERGYVVDDGLIARENDTRFYLTFTSGGSSFAEGWLRDWAESWGLDVRIMNRTQSLGAINVTGPLATHLLQRAGLAKLPAFMRHLETELAGVRCKVFRLSFTGEVSYELHHSVEHSVYLWQTLMALGTDLGIKAHGLEALDMLRLEKGHIIVNKDTDFDSTPRRLQHGWLVNMSKPDFVGKQALSRTDNIPLNKALVGLEVAKEAAPQEGDVIYHGDDYAGYITSATYSPVLGTCVMLAWLYVFAGDLPAAVTVRGHSARRVPTPFYNPEASRARA